MALISIYPEGARCYRWAERSAYGPQFAASYQGDRVLYNSVRDSEDACRDAFEEKRPFTDLVTGRTWFAEA